MSMSDELSSRLILSNALAQSMVAACFADQAENGYSNVNVFVVDDGGHLLAASRQDGACKACASIAENKAITSALYGAPTRVFADLSFGENRDGVDAGLPGAAFVPGLVAFAGGLPISTADGAVIGGIGVSGASSDEDEQCAQAGLDAISASLN
ncbi:heme-binding protein [Celeribacter marinus]|uniref:GlcG/HbpS family heme-binding protein n=1 Tax=Celeribacter marinus TaxID=1397108 RepID=UPI003178B5B1